MWEKGSFMDSFMIHFSKHAEILGDFACKYSHFQITLEFKVAGGVVGNSWKQICAHVVCSGCHGDGWWLRITQHPEAPDLVHEQRGDDVPGQNGQSSQETDKVDHVGVVLVTDVAEHAALFVVQESAVYQSAVDQSVLEKIWTEGPGRGWRGGW